MNKNDDYVTLTAVGDIMLGWGVEERIKGWSGGYPFESVAPILQSSDITFGNLEAPLTTESKKAVWDYTKILDKPVIIDGKTYGSSIYCKADPVAAKDDFIRLPSGKTISPITMHLIVKHTPGIVECQVVQESLDKISVILVVMDKFTDVLSERLVREIKQALNCEVSVDVRVVDAIQRGPNGKMRMVISKVKP